MTHSCPLVRPQGPSPLRIPSAGGLHRSRSVGLSAFAVGKAFSPLPKWLKSQAAEVPRGEGMAAARVVVRRVLLQTQRLEIRCHAAGDGLIEDRVPHRTGWKPVLLIRSG